MASTCLAEAAGYDGMFGVYCELPKGHDGPHNDGFVEWDFIDPRYRNSKTPPSHRPTGQELDGGEVRA